MHPFQPEAAGQDPGWRQSGLIWGRCRGRTLFIHLDSQASLFSFYALSHEARDGACYC